MRLRYLRHFLTSLLLLTTQVHHSWTQPGADPDVQTCNSCCQGPPGLNGIPGSSGTPGSAGIPGSNGINGSPGRDGIPGRNGINGRDGIRAEGGLKGDKGDIGIGIQGLQGPEGPPGDRGESGLRGLPGKVGPVGSAGEAGMKGRTGDPGGKGEPAGSRRSAFSVQRTGSQATSSNYETFTFDQARVNIGGHFNLSSSRFTCQIPGTYFFSYSLYALYNSPETTNVMLKKDGDTIAHSHSRTGSLPSCSSTMVHLDVGNQVWIEHQGGDGFDCSSEKCQFSGYLVCKNE